MPRRPTRPIPDRHDRPAATHPGPRPIPATAPAAAIPRPVAPACEACDRPATRYHSCLQCAETVERFGEGPVTVFGVHPRCADHPLDSSQPCPTILAHRKARYQEMARRGAVAVYEGTLVRDATRHLAIRATENRRIDETDDGEPQLPQETVHHRVDAPLLQGRDDLLGQRIRLTVALELLDEEPDRG